jgi:hypothetical protein
MERIKSILLEQGKTVPDSAIEAKLNEYGLDGEISEADAKAIAAELEPEAQPISNGLAVSNGSGKATKRKPAARKPKEDRLTKTPKLDNPIGNLAKQVTEEVGNYVDAFRQASDAAAEIDSDKVMEIVENHSSLFLEKLGEKARDYKGNPAFFRQRGEDDAGAAFGISFTAEA